MRFSPTGGQFLFHLGSKLYENTSLLITANLALANCPLAFGADILTPVEAAV